MPDHESASQKLLELNSISAEERAAAIVEFQNNGCEPLEAGAKGPKLDRFHAEVTAACKAGDLERLLRASQEIDADTCDLFVDSFELTFDRTGESQWIFRQERPSPLTNTLKIYELIGQDLNWSLIETRVPTSDSTDAPTRTVWKTSNPGLTEPACDLVSFSVAYPF